MKKSGKDRLKSTIYESTLSTADAVPLPQWGRQRYEDTAFLDTTPFTMGKAKRRRLGRPKRKPTPPRCARQPLPREGARVGIPSFLWKEVPRRGGGWMGIAVFPKHSLHQWGRLRYEDVAFLVSSKRIQDTWRKTILTDKAFPAWGRWRAERAG